MSVYDDLLKIQSDVEFSDDMTSDTELIIEGAMEKVSKLDDSVKGIIAVLKGHHEHDLTLSSNVLGILIKDLETITKKLY